MIVTFRNKMIVTFGPWLKGEGAWSAHLPLRTLRRTTTNDDDDDEDEASPSGPGSRGGCLVSTPAPTDCIRDHLLVWMIMVIEMIMVMVRCPFCSETTAFASIGRH